jgi:uncharacterized protein
MAAWPAIATSSCGACGFTETSVLGYAVAGVMVGFGTRMGSGCTSGHGLMGNARFSARSIAATLSFVPLAMFSAVVANTSGFLRERDVVQDVGVVDEYWYVQVVAAGALLALSLGAWAFFRPASDGGAAWAWEAAGSAASGLLFGVGLVVGGMGSRTKVLQFLTVTSVHWDSQLMFVLGAGVVTSALVFHWVHNKMERPLWSDHFHLPSATAAVTLQLVLGSAVFGFGWGLSGYCPGPALLNLFHWRVSLVFLPCVAAGMVAWRFAEPHWERLTKLAHATPAVADQKKGDSKKVDDKKGDSKKVDEQPQPSGDRSVSSGQSDDLSTPLMAPSSPASSSTSHRKTSPTAIAAESPPSPPSPTSSPVPGGNTSRLLTKDEALRSAARAILAAAAGQRPAAAIHASSHAHAHAQEGRAHVTAEDLGRTILELLSETLEDTEVDVGPAGRRPAAAAPYGAVIEGRDVLDLWAGHVPDDMDG